MNLLQADSEHSSRPGALKHPVPISAVDSPALLVDGERLERNLAGMQALADAAGVTLRPHAKTHKAIAVARRQQETGAVGLCTAKVSEADTFLAGGLRGILVAYPLVGAKAEALAVLAARTPDTLLEGAADSVEGLFDLGRAASRNGVTLGVWLKVDVGLHRAGLAPDDPGLATLALRALSTPGLRLRGLLTHAGHVYAASPQDVAAIGREEGERLVRAARELERQGTGPLKVGLGSTPTAAAAARVEGVDEIHPGVYVFGDRQQVQLGAMQVQDLALSVLATVVSRPAPGRWVLDTGSKTLSSDRGAHGTEGVRGYGTVRALDAHRPSEGGPLPFVTPMEARTPSAAAADAAPVLTRLSEEHAVLEHKAVLPWGPGDRVEILPNHACAAVNLARALYVTEGAGEDRRVVAVWPVTARACVQ